jgi:hypothetical protein
MKLPKSSEITSKSLTLFCTFFWQWLLTTLFSGLLQHFLQSQGKYDINCLKFQLIAADILT